MLKVTLMGLYIWIEPEIQVMMEDFEVPKQSLHQLSLFKVSFILVVVVYTCLLKDKHLIFIRTRQRRTYNLYSLDFEKKTTRKF